MLPTRPRPGETEEDVLRLQQDFLESKNRTAASAKVVRVDKRTSDDGLRSVFEPIVESGASGSSLKNDSSAKRFKTGDHRPSPMLVEDPPSLDNVLSDIVERDTGMSRASPPKPANVGIPFPLVHPCDPKDLRRCLLPKPMADNSRRNVSSIFARRVRKESHELAVTTKSMSDRPVLESDDDSSCVIDGTGLDPSRSQQLAKEIHDENRATLSRMSIDEIIEHRNRLIGSLDAKTLEYVRSRRRHDARTPDVRMCDVAVVESSRQESQSSVLGDIEIGKWLHMDKVEADKLAWTRPLPECNPPVDAKTGYRARFDLDGGIVARDSDVPVHYGLHHHGDEPEVAGYTLEDLFTLGRSSLLQQRVLALTTLARILQRYNMGDHDRYLVDAAQFLTKILDSGLVLLLRWALDDNTESCLVATVSAIHALLVRTADNHFSDEVFCWSRGHEQPYLRPTRVETKDAELSDADLVAVDVVKGLVRMDVLPRLRYILDVVRPSSSPAVVHHSLEIIDRISKHSPQAAQAVADCPWLIETIVREFLPKSWTTQGTTAMQSVYGFPVRQAVRLMRTLASTSHRLAADLLRRHDLMASLLCYASVDTSDPVDSDLARLSLEAYRTWTVFIYHGLTVDHFSDFFPLIVGQLRLCQSLCLSADIEKHKFDCDFAAQLIGLLTAAIVPLASLADASSSSSAWNRLLPPLFLPIELCLKKWLWEMAHADETTSASLKLIGIALTFVATFYEATTRISDNSKNDVVARLEDLFSLAIVPFLESNGLRYQLERLRDCSVFAQELLPSGDRDVPSLPSLGALLCDGRVHPILTERSPFPFLGHLVRALLIFRAVHSSLQSRICDSLMAGELVEGYWRQLGSAHVGGDSSDWFSRFEVHFVADLMELQDSRPLPSCHTAATTVLHQFQTGDERLALRLLASVIFNDKFLGCVDDDDDDVQPLGPCMEAPSKTSSMSRSDLLRRTRGSLADIGETYMRNIVNLKSGPSSDGGTLMVEHSRVSIVPPSFEYSPIADLFFHDSNDAVDEHKLTVVVHCLQWSHLLQCRGRGDATRESRFCYLAMVTLIGTDVFLDPLVQSYLRDSVLLMAERGELLDMNLDSKPLPQMTSFDDFYEQLVLQFEAVSYGDHLFGILVLVPMQMSQPLRLRRSMWSVEHRCALRCLGVRPDELPVPLSAFLEPLETDAALIDSYFSALVSGHVRPSWCPILYLIAVHHVHGFLFHRTVGGCLTSEQDAGRARDMFKRLQGYGESSDLYRHVTLYAGPNRAAPLVFDLSNSLDAQVTARLSEMSLCS